MALLGKTNNQNTQNNNQGNGQNNNQNNNQGNGQRGGRPTRMNARSMSRARTDIVVTDTVEPLEKIMRESMVLDGWNFRFVPISGSLLGMHYSLGALVAHTQKNGINEGIAFIYIFAGSNTPPVPQNVMIQAGYEVSYLEVPQDSWDAETWEKCKSQIETQLGADITLHLAGQSVVPESYTPSTEDTSDVYNIGYMAYEAIANKHDIMYPHEADSFSIARDIRAVDNTGKVVGTPQKPVASFEYNGDPAYDLLGNPIRNDFTMTLSLVDQNNHYWGGAPQQRKSFQHSNSRNVMKVHGYVNLVSMLNQYGQQDTASAMMMQQQQPQMAFGMMPKQWLPQIIITGMEGLDYNLTPELACLGLGTVMLLEKDMAFMRCFGNYRNEVMHDIGGIGLTMPDVGSVIDTKDQSFGDPQLMELAAKSIWPTPTYTIACEQAGPLSWITDIIKETAQGSVDAAADFTAMYDRLTDNRFTPIFQQRGGNAGNMFRHAANLLVGTYNTDNDGTVRSIDDIDDLYMLNRTYTTMPDEYAKFRATYGGTITHPNFAINDRMAIINEWTRNTARYHGRRFDTLISPVLADTIKDALIQSNLAVDSKGLTHQNGIMYQGVQTNAILANMHMSQVQPTYGHAFNQMMPGMHGVPGNIHYNR